MPTDSNVCSLIQPLDRSAESTLHSFIQVAEQERGYLTCVAGRMTASKEEAEDIVQQALLKAFVNLSRFRGDSKMRTWLHAIVLNTGREHLRKEKRQIPLQQASKFEDGDQDILNGLPHPQMSPEQLCQRNEMAAILHSEIGLLTPACKDALELCVIHDLSHEATAKALRTKAATVKSRVHRAKAILRRAMRSRMQLRNRKDELEETSSKKQSRRRDPIAANSPLMPGMIGKPAHAM